MGGWGGMSSSEPRKLLNLFDGPNPLEVKLGYQNKLTSTILPCIDVGHDELMRTNEKL